MRDNIDVTDIGRRSLTSLTGVHSGTGVITAVRHADGTTLEATDVLKTQTIHVHSHGIPNMERYHYQVVFLVRANISSILSLE